MDKVRLLLTLITIAIVVIPIAGMLLAYQNNLLGLFVPPEITEIADDLMGSDGMEGLEPPTMVGEPKYDEATRTFSANFEYKNTFPLNISINWLSGNIECAEHHFPLGNVSLSKPVSIDARETGTLTVLGTWTDEAISHFETVHKNEELVDAALVDCVIDISGIQLQMDQSQIQQSIQIPNPAKE